MQEVNEVLRKLTGRQLNQLQGEINTLYEEYVRDAYWASLEKLHEADSEALVTFTIENNERLPVVEVAVPDWKTACQLFAHVTVPLEYAGVKVDLGSGYIGEGLQLCIAIHHFPEELYWVKTAPSYPNIALKTILKERENTDEPTETE